MDQGEAVHVMNNCREDERKCRTDKNGLTEEEFLKRYDPGKYPRPSLTADILIFRRSGDKIHLLMIRRKGHPYLGYLALPGGFAEAGETLEETAERELCEETGVTGYGLRLVGVYSRPGRDPRGWTVSAAYSAVVDAGRIKAEAGDDAESVQWIPVEKDNSGDVHLACDEPLAFDHAEIIRDAIGIMLK